MRISHHLECRRLCLHLKAIILYDSVPTWNMNSAQSSFWSFLGAYFVCFLQMPQNFLKILSIVFPDIPGTVECPLLSSLQSRRLQGHDRTQKEPTGDYVMSCVCPASTDAVSLVSVRVPHTLQELLENTRSSHPGFPCGPRNLVFSVNCFSRLGLSVQEAVALLVTLLKFPLLGRCGPN